MTDVRLSVRKGLFCTGLCCALLAAAVWQVEASAQNKTLVGAKPSSAAAAANAQAG